MAGAGSLGHESMVRLIAPLLVRIAEPRPQAKRWPAGRLRRRHLQSLGAKTSCGHSDAEEESLARGGVLLTSYSDTARVEAHAVYRILPRCYNSHVKFETRHALV